MIRLLDEPQLLLGPIIVCATSLSLYHSADEYLLNKNIGLFCLPVATKNVHIFIFDGRGKVPKRAAEKDVCLLSLTFYLGMREMSPMSTSLLGINISLSL